MSGPQTKPQDFWSKRRARVAAEAEALEAQVTEAEQAKLEDRADAEILSELDLPDPETLDSPDAVRDFLQAELPQRLKTRALRRLWRLNPVLANLDGLVDYGEDFTDSATVIENMQTVYQVGKGMLEQFAGEEAEEEDASDTPSADPEDPPAPEPTVIVAEAPVPEPDPAPEPDPVAMPQRRMRFAFDTA